VDVVTSQELGAAIVLAGYAVVFALLIRALGVRRVLGGLGIVVLLAVVVAFKTLGVIVGGRRY
jgi:hypothetical protein